MRDELNRIIDFFKENKEYLKKEFGVLEIGLFGSVVNDKLTEKSDIDIIVDLETNKKNLHNFLRLKRLLTRRLGRKVDLGLKGSTKPYIFEKIKDKIIYV